jgi:hypothetical protein
MADVLAATWDHLSEYEREQQQAAVTGYTTACPKDATTAAMLAGEKADSKVASKDQMLVVSKV